MNALRRWLSGVGAAAAAVTSWSAPALAEHTPDDAPCAVAYSAPSECPGPEVLSQAVGPHFQVRVEPSDCEECVAQVEITRDAANPARFVLHSGPEPTHSDDCAELVKIAGFTVRSSHVHQPPKPRAPFLHLGVYGARLLNESPQWSLGAQLAIRPFEYWQVRPHGGWTPLNTVSGPIAGLALDYRGSHAGLDVCRAVFTWASACVASELQWFTVSPAGRDWTAPRAAQLMVGLGTSHALRVVSDLEVQLQPTVLFAPRQARVRESDWSTTLYERPRLQLHIRAVIAWGFGGTRHSAVAGENFAETRRLHVTH